jgi:hypothetical protein
MKWIVGVFVASAVLLLACFVSAQFMRGDSPAQEGLWGLMFLLAFMGMSCSTVLLAVVVPRVWLDRKRERRYSVFE